MLNFDITLLLLEEESEMNKMKKTVEIARSKIISLGKSSQYILIPKNIRASFDTQLGDIAFWSQEPNEDELIIRFGKNKGDGGNA